MIIPAALRAEAEATFARMGLPGRDNEAWKYTPTTALSQVGFQPPPAEPRPATASRVLVKGLVADLAFVNGVCVARACGPARSLLEALPAQLGLIDAHLARLADFRDPKLGALLALNTAHFPDAAILDVPAQATPDPVYLHFHGCATEEPTVYAPRALIHVGEGAVVQIIEHHTGSGPCWNNAVTEVIVEAGAKVTFVRIQEQDGDTFHTGATYVRLARGARFASFDFTCGAKLTRSELHVALEGEGSEANLSGVYVLGGQAHADHYTVIEHKAPHTTSTELYKGVLDGRSRGVFTGCIRMNAGCSGATTRQKNPNLLLSNEAHIESRPQLEIKHNDVKAYHGATVGRLDEDALFYLRSRGLDEDGARRLLTTAFVGEVIDAIGIEAVEGHLRTWLHGALGGSAA